MVKSLLPPHVPPSLLLHDILLRRGQLSTMNRQQYNRLYNGFIGEKKLAHFIACNNFTNVHPLHSLLLDVDEAELQIDFLLLTTDTIYLLEVKNYKGNYSIQDDTIYSLQTNKEISNPFIQLERSTFLFNKLLDQLNTTIDVRSYIIFVNDSFTLYNAPTHLPIVFPTQINHFFQKINANSAPLTNRVSALAKSLTNRHIDQSAYERLPSYDSSKLKQGVFCTTCRRRLSRKNKMHFMCQHCETATHMDDVILHATAEYNVLLPKRKITTQHITNWCGGVLSKNTIRNGLSNNLKKIANGRYTHYLFHGPDDSFNLLIDAYYGNVF